MHVLLIAHGLISIDSTADEIVIVNNIGTRTFRFDC